MPHEGDLVCYVRIGLLPMVICQEGDGVCLFGAVEYGHIGDRFFYICTNSCKKCTSCVHRQIFNKYTSIKCDLTGYCVYVSAYNTIIRECMCKTMRQES